MVPSQLGSVCKMCSSYNYTEVLCISHVHVHWHYKLCYERVPSTWTELHVCVVRMLIMLVQCCCSLSLVSFWLGLVFPKLLLIWVDNLLNEELGLLFHKYHIFLGSVLHPITGCPWLPHTHMFTLEHTPWRGSRTHVHPPAPLFKYFKWMHFFSTKYCSTDMICQYNYRIPCNSL